jgi:hypothetical protein
MKTLNFYCLKCGKKFKKRNYEIIKVPFRVVAIAYCRKGHKVSTFVRPLTKEEIEEMKKKKREIEELEKEMIEEENEEELEF